LTYWPDSKTAEDHYQDLLKVHDRVSKEVGANAERVKMIKRILDASDIERNIKSKTQEHFK